MDVLSESQARIWKLMSPERNSPTAFNRDPDEEVGMKARFAALGVEIRKAVEAGRMTKEQATERLEGLRRNLWGDPTVPGLSDQAEMGKRENTARQLAEAKKRGLTCGGKTYTQSKGATTTKNIPAFAETRNCPTNSEKRGTPSSFFCSCKSGYFTMGGFNQPLRCEKKS
ncbi:MAG TPA: hypothetical protein EYQ50_25245, partial [Verrucomicrobiales bacterium]|nr:hypothetical protein [Verrucomicrobiales bacterium]